MLGFVRTLGLDRLIAAKPSRQRERVLAMVVASTLALRSKLATTHGLCDEMLSHTLGETLGLGQVDADAIYGAMDWLLKRRGRLSNAWPSVISLTVP